MKTIEMAEAKDVLSSYAKRLRRQPLVLTRGGRPVAAVVPLNANDWEDFVVAQHPGFLKVLRRGEERAKTEPDIPLEELLAKHARESKRPRRTRRPAPRVARRSRPAR